MTQSNLKSKSYHFKVKTMSVIISINNNRQVINFISIQYFFFYDVNPASMESMSQWFRYSIQFKRFRFIDIYNCFENRSITTLVPNAATALGYLNILFFTILLEADTASHYMAVFRLLDITYIPTRFPHESEWAPLSNHDYNIDNCMPSLGRELRTQDLPRARQLDECLNQCTMGADYAL